MRTNIEYDKTEMEKCLRGEMYYAMFPGREKLVAQALEMCQEYNRIPAKEKESREKLLRELFGRLGKNPDVEPNLFCGFGFNIEAGDNFYANNGCNFVDAAKITFGDNVFIGPDCGFYTAHHPIGYKLRNRFFEMAYPVSVGDNVWFGGGCRVLPGVTIGSNVVVGAGSVVTHDIPDNCVAAGNPCRVIRYIDEDGNECERTDNGYREAEGKGISECRKTEETEVSMDYGKKVWIFADGDMPPQGDREPFGHEALTVTNCTDTDAVVKVSVLFTDREPDRFILRIGARRVNCFRLDYPVGEEGYQIPKGQYSLILESNVPVVSVLGRLDRRKDFAYYEMDGYCE